MINLLIQLQLYSFQCCCILMACSHYRTRVLCRVSQTLGKGRKTLGNFFAECSTRRSAHSLSSTSEAGFAECLFSGTRQTVAVCQAALGKKKLKRDGQQQTGERNGRTGRMGRPNGTGSKTLPSAREKPASPVEERSCALRRVLHSTKKLPSVCDTQQSPRVR